MSARSRKGRMSETTSSTKKVISERTRATPDSGERSPSPLNISRAEEKDELCYLNDRLAGYIEYVRTLERENEKLTSKIKFITEERFDNIDSVRKTYENEINSLRNLLEDLTKQNCEADLQAKRAQDELQKVVSKNDELVKKNRRLEHDTEEALKKAEAYKKEYDNYKVLKNDCNQMEMELANLRKALDNEKALRINLENKVTGLLDEIDFKDRLLKEERVTMKHTTTIVEESSEAKEAEFASRLVEELREIRAQTAVELENYKTEMEETFEKKVDQLREAGRQALSSANHSTSEIKNLRNMNKELSDDLARKTADLGILQKRLSDLEKRLEIERSEHDDVEKMLRNEIARLSVQLEDSFRDFTELMNTKIALDQEILMYRKMLEGEESRLNIKSPSRNSSFDVSRPTKRRRLDGDDFDDEDETGYPLSGSPLQHTRSRFRYRVSTTAIGGLEFSGEQDGTGKWVRLHNTTDEDVNIGNWQLKQISDDVECTYKFHRALTVKPKETCTIWSSDTTTTHNPPTDVVMKNQTFHAGRDIKLSLCNSDGVEQARCTVTRERMKTTGYTSRRPRRTPQDERCQVM